MQQADNDRAVPDMDRIVNTYGTQILRMCYMYLKDAQYAEDAVQDTFIKVYRAYGSFCGDSSEKTWIMRIAINVCKDMLRSAWQSRVDVSEELEGMPYEDVHESEDDTVLKAVMQLKPRYKDVILLFYYQDMKMADIAMALNCPIATVGVRLKRARAQLKDKLGGVIDE